MTDEQRDFLCDRIEEHLARYGSEAGRVIEVFAKTHAMHHTDLRALVVIMNADRQGTPATPGDLRRELDLTSGAVTGTVDRLVLAGHVSREPDRHDRRQVRLRRAAPGQALARQFFAPLGQMGAAVMDRFDVDQLRVIEEFMAAMAEAMARHRVDIGCSGPDAEPPDA